jgi:hypothetical protein
MEGSLMSEALEKKILSGVLCVLLVIISTPIDARAAMAFQSQEAAPASDYSGQGAPLTAAELQALVAPIALYPDALVAQILSGATFPDQVAIADNWLQTNKALTGTALTQAVDKQTWDPSIKALTEFPSVLNKMAQSLAWTSSLGEAYHNQQADVMTAVQTLRAQAKKAGNLKSGAQITVVQQSPQTIVIQPTNPQIVYVPEYNPTIVYGYPYVTPGYSAGAVIATGVLAFGAGLAVGAMMSDGWGYSTWNCDWHGGAVYYHGGAYYGNSAWHGGYYGGGYYNNGYHNNNYNNYNHSNYNNSGHNNYNSGNRTNVSGNTVNVNNVNRSNSSSLAQGDKSGGWDSASSSHGWGQSGSSRGASAFGGSSGGGWQSRTSSARGWGSSGGGGGWGGRSSGGGFGGGSFGGFGGGGFRGGGGRR